MREFVKIKKDFSNIQKFKKELERKFYVRVGVLGDSTGRNKVITTKSGNRKPGKEVSNQTNAEIGFQHEFGVKSKKIPKRSFLREPLRFRLQDEVRRSESSFQKNINLLDIKSIYKTLGTIAERIIQKAFRTRGFGRWKENSPSTIARKGSDSPLIDSGQLRKSITSEVKERK